MANKGYEQKVTISAIDKVSSPMRKMANNLAPVGRQFKAIGKAAAAASRELRGFFPPFASILSGALIYKGITGMARLTQNVANYGDTVANTAKRIGWSAKAFQEYSYAAKYANMSGEGFAASLETMSKNMSQLRAGTGKMMSSLQKVPPALLEQIQAAESNEEAFEIMIGAIRQVDDINEKRFLAEAFFGNGDMIHFADLTAEELERLRQEAIDTGNVLGDKALEDSSAFNNALITLKEVMSGLAKTIGSVLIPILTPLINHFSELIKLNREDIGKQFEQYAEQFATWLKEINFKEIITGIKSFATMLGNLVKGVGGVKNAFIILMVFMNSNLIISVFTLIGSIGSLGRMLSNISKDELKLFVGGLKSMGSKMLNVGKTAAVSLAGDLKSLGKFIVRTAKQQIPIFIGGLKTMGSSMLSIAKTAIAALTKGIIVFGKALLTTPLGWFMAAIAAVAGIAILVYKNWDKVKAWFSAFGGFMGKLWDGIKNKIASVWEGIKGVVSTAFEFIKTIIMAFNPLGFIIQNWEPIKDFMLGMWDSVKESALGAFEFIKNIVSNIGKWILEKSGISTIMGLIDKVKGWFGGDNYETAASLSDGGSPSPAIQAAHPSPLIMSGAASRSQTEITIKMENLPRGTTVDTETSGSEPDLGVEYGFAS